MDNNADIMELLDILYGMVTEAWGVPLGNDKCIIEREKAVEIINEIKANLPTSVAEAKRLVSARDDFIGNAKREAESLRKNAEEQAKAMIEQQEIVRVARAKSSEMMASAEAKSNELRRVASEYVENIIRQSEESMSAALADIQNVRKAFALSGAGSSATAKAKAPAPQPAPAPAQKRPPVQEEYGYEPEYGYEQEYGYEPEPDYYSPRVPQQMDFPEDDYDDSPLRPVIMQRGEDE